MIQNYKIHINNRVIWLASSGSITHNGKTIEPAIVKFKSEDQIEEFLLKLNGFENTKEIILYSKDLRKLKKAFFRQFKLIEAAGGVVVNENNDILMIFRKGKWDLPKGKVEKGESVDTGATREVEEETGVHVENIQVKLPDTYHTYVQGEKKILKIVHWYLMHGKSTSVLQPQGSENIEKAVWVPLHKVDKKLKNTYRSIEDVVFNARQILQ